MVYKRYNIGMDEDVWKGAETIIKTQLNMSMSKYIEIMLRQLMASQTQTQRQMYENLASLLFQEMSPKSVQKVPKKVKKKGTK